MIPDRERDRPRALEPKSPEVEASRHGPEAAPVSLVAALRRARTEEAERSEVVAELRGAERARLEMLADALAPIFAQVPENVDIFDASLVPGERPRLWIDLLGFVEMGRDRRQYRFLQNTRHGRVVLAENERMDPIVEAITTYVARRILEREQALAADRTIEDAARAYASRPVAPVSAPVGAGAVLASAPLLGPAIVATSPAPPHGRHVLTGLMFALIDVLGAVVLFAALAGLSYWAWKAGWTWWTGLPG